MKNEKLLKIFNPTSKMRETILFILIVVINGLIWIESDIELDTCARGGEGWRCWWSFGLEHFVQRLFVLFNFFFCYFHYYCVCTNKLFGLNFYLRVFFKGLRVMFKGHKYFWNNATHTIFSQQILCDNLILVS